MAARAHAPIFLALCFGGLVAPEAALVEPPSCVAQSEAEVEALESREIEVLDVRLLQTRAQAVVVSAAAAVTRVAGTSSAGGADEDAPAEETVLLQGSVAGQAAAVAVHPYSCAGDGSPTQNPNCAMNPSRSGCTWSPGCNWNGESHFDGWCSGSSSCVYTSGAQACIAMAGCTWMKSVRPVNMTAEREADEVDAARTAQQIKVANDALQAVAQCKGDGTTTENPYCKFIPSSASCQFAPGCNWHGQNSYGGWCSGGTHCVQEMSTFKCASAGCTWVAAAADKAPASTPSLAALKHRRRRGPGCTGDGTPTQNPNCIYNPSRSGCTWSPGCNWEGESHFGGWCSGSLACVYTSSPEVCQRSGCRWLPAARPVNMTAEREMDLQGARDSARAARAADDAARAASPCQGGGGVFENPWCKYIPMQAQCMLTPGCNFQGMSSFGGWCRGVSPLCAAQPAPFICTALVGCEWAAASAQYTGGPPVGAAAEEAGAEAEAADESAPEEDFAPDLPSTTKAAASGGRAAQAAATPTGSSGGGAAADEAAVEGDDEAAWDSAASAAAAAPPSPHRSHVVAVRAALGPQGAPVGSVRVLLPSSRRMAAAPPRAPAAPTRPSPAEGRRPQTGAAAAGA